MSVNADKLVQIVPRVIDGGTVGLTFSGMMLTQSELPPSGRVLRFASAQAVAAYFGADSDEAALAQIYFRGYVNTASLPDQLFIAPWRAEAAAAWLRGAPCAGSLAALKEAGVGGLVISINSETYVLDNLDFSDATSFSDIAERLQAALAPAPVPASSARLLGGDISLADLAEVADGGFVLDVDGESLDISGLDFSGADSLEAVKDALAEKLSGKALVALSPAMSGLVIASPKPGADSGVGFAKAPESGTDVSALLGLAEASGAVIVPGTDAETPAGAIVSFSSQTNAWQITSPSTGAESTISFASPPESGTDFATMLGLTAQAGAVESPGIDGQTLSGCMSNILGYARDWVTFGTVWEPSLDQKLELAKWASGYDTRFCYVMWDSDNAAQVMGSRASAGYQIDQSLELDGTCPVFNTAQLMAWVMGTAACINFDEYNGRLTFAFKQGAGLTVTCDNDENYDALLENGYNCYADFATASTQFKFFQPGQVSGKWDWLDTYLNAIALKDGLQLNLLDLFRAVKSIPYNEDGYSMVRTACLDTINRFLKFGAIRRGITLSQTQKVQLLAEIGQDVSRTIEALGWYMQVKDPGAVVRAARGTPDCRFYYTDGGSIHKIVMPATAIQ